MTETYAATIAAVVPVLWLVAVLEYQQYMRHMMEPLRYSVRLARLRRRVEEQDVEQSDLESLAALIMDIDAAIKDEALVPPLEPEPPIRKRVAWIYSVTSMILISTETSSLGWLAGPQRPQPWLAYVCLAAVAASFLAVGYLPLKLAVGEGRHGHEHRKQDVAAISNYLDRQADVLGERLRLEQLSQTDPTSPNAEGNNSNPA